MAEHHRDHRCRNKEVNKFCYDTISKYRGNFCGCITRHHPVWAGSRSWVSRHLSLHLSIRGDEVRVCSCLIFRYGIWPKKQCILEKHSNLLQKYNSCRLLLTITHKYLSSHETRKHCHIIARVAAFWQRVFQTLPNLDVHPGVAVYHALKIFSIVNAKDLLMPHTKFQVCTLKINTIFCHRKKKSHYFWTVVYMPQNFTDGTICYQSQRWPSSMWPYGIIGPQCVELHFSCSQIITFGFNFKLKFINICLIIHLVFGLFNSHQDSLQIGVFEVNISISTQCVCHLFAPHLNPNHGGTELSWFN